ncbi:MAG: hypothetical protein ACYC6Y_29045, partial [Thermoguttaceae bacterium]
AARPDRSRFRGERTRCGLCGGLAEAGLSRAAGQRARLAAGNDGGKRLPAGSPPFPKGSTGR